MFEITALSPFMAILLVLAIAGVVSYAIAEIAKRAIASYLASTPQSDKEPWWYNTVIRILALLAGSGAGALLMTWPLGALVGFAGGALNTTIVMIVKKKLKGLKLGQGDE